MFLNPITAWLKARFFAFFAIMAMAGVPHAFADETFNYTGKPYTTNTNPALLGAQFMASVTIPCTGICADGTYSQSNSLVNDGQVSSLDAVQLWSGAVSLTMNAPGVLVEVASVTLSDNQVASWALSLYATPVPLGAQLNTF
jgi:hypothetical protein